MCGIAGFEARATTPTERIERLTERLRRRGPDGSWTTRHGDYELVQTRLAVIDLSGRVVYPIPNEQEDVWLLFNGEIYNHDALRTELRSRGHSFRTQCDAEVVVHAFEEWGDAAFARLNGMFAIALIDERAGTELVLARDRLGIKPLFFTTGRAFGFSSDALSLVRAGLSAGEPDVDALACYATLHYIAPPQTGLTDVASLEPGTLLRRDQRGTVDIKRWAPRPLDEPSSLRHVSLSDVDSALRDAVERQLQADVDVGVFLSSGTDSALVLSYAAEVGATPKTFTARFAGHGDYDESVTAAAVARAFGSRHYVCDVTPSFEEAIHTVAEAFDVPFGDSSALPTLALARFARPYITVALTGTGGDDLFAGYYRYRAHRVRRVAAILAPLARVVGPTTRGAERRSTLSLFRSYSRRILEASSSADAAQQYLALISDAATPRLLNALNFDVSPADVLERLVTGLELASANERDPVRGLQAFDLATYLPGDLLTKEDRATMAVGLEGRVPLLDDETVRIVAAMPDSQKVSLLQGKRPLRALVRKRLPVSLPKRKRGFAVPLRAFFEGAWTDQANAWLSSQVSSLVDTRTAASLIAGGKAGPDTWALCALLAWEDALAAERRAAPVATAA